MSEPSRRTSWSRTRRCTAFLLVVPLMIAGLTAVFVTGTGGSSPAAAATAPIRAAFYYPWYPETWSQGTHYTPSLGRYDSSATSVVDAHINAMTRAHIQAGIASWWGQGTRTDSRIPLLLQEASRLGTGLKWTLYYEHEGDADPTSATIQGDLNYLYSHYASNPAYLHVGGRPVLFVFGSANDGCAMASRWAAANTDDRFYLVLKVFSGYTSCASQPDSWHQYAPAVANEVQLPYSYSISPGFWSAGETTPRLARDLNRWKASISSMVASGAQWQLIATFNEWGEGTAVESATQWGTSYLDALAATGPPPPTPSSVTTLAVTASNDAFIAADQPTAAHNGSWVTTDASPQRYGYYRFDVTVPAGWRVTAATFRCYAGSANSAGASLWRSTSNGWTESTLTWNNATKPDFALPALGSTGAVGAGAYASVNVTSAVAASGSYTFVARTTSTTAWSCASTENTGTHPPSLVLTLVSTTPPTTPPPTGTTIVDAIGDGGPDTAHWNSPLAARLVADKPALMLWAGDVRNTGTPAEWALYDHNYGALKSVTLATPGNHDWPNAAIGYDVEFATDPYTDTATYCNGVTLPGGWKLFSINTYTRSTCLPKLTAFLASPGTRKIVVTHEPRWSGGNARGANSAQEPIWSAMKGHAFALVSGHDHDSQVIEADGMVQLVSGCAGASYYGVAPSLVTSPASLVYYSTSVSDCTYDRLALGASSVTVEAVHADGTVDFRKTYAVTAP